MDPALRALVAQRAGHRCEYCRLPEQFVPVGFHVEHIIAKQHRGKTIRSNLALACLNCNGHKGPNISGIDWLTSPRKLVRLFIENHKPMDASMAA